MSVYRIKRSTASIDDALLADDSGAESSKSEDKKETAEGYLEKAIKLIPADVVAAYLALRNIWLETAGGGDDKLGELVSLWILPIGGFVAVILLRILGTSESFASFKKIQWPAVWVSTIAYVAWVLSFNDPILSFEAPDPRLAASLLVLISIIGPSFVKTAED